MLKMLQRFAVLHLVPLFLHNTSTWTNESYELHPQTRLLNLNSVKIQRQTSDDNFTARLQNTQPVLKYLWETKSVFRSIVVYFYERKVHLHPKRYFALLIFKDWALRKNVKCLFNCDQGTPGNSTANPTRDRWSAAPPSQPLKINKFSNTKVQSAWTLFDFCCCFNENGLFVENHKLIILQINFTNIIFISNTRYTLTQRAEAGDSGVFHLTLFYKATVLFYWVIAEM